MKSEKNQPFGLAYIDAFAGSGYIQVNKTDYDCFSPGIHLLPAIRRNIRLPGIAAQSQAERIAEGRACGALLPDPHGGLVRSETFLFHARMRMSASDTFIKSESYTS